MKVTAILLLTVFFVSMFMVIQPFSQEALADTTMPNASAIYLEEKQQISTETTDKNDSLGEITISTGTTGSTDMATTSTESNNYNPSTIYPSKVGTVLIVSGNTVSIGSVGK